jgi:hypothetical protein
MKTLILFILLIFIFTVGTVAAQKKTPLVKVCGDPAAACAKRALFHDDDIPFLYTDGAPAAETAPFYVVIVKSAKLTADQECEKVPDDFSRLSFQYAFPNNKVFIARGCYSIMNNYYEGIGQDVIALAVYAGTTKAEADKVLKKVKAMEYFNTDDAYLLRISTGFNGT